jgi:signal transduction histidine kinase
MEIESIKRVDKDSYEKNKKTFESIQEEVQRMKKLTEGLLTLVRKDDSNSLTKFSLNELLEESSEQMRKSAEEKSITLSIELGKESGITANRDQVKQVLMILLDNAIKYTNAGGKITIQETQEKKSVKVQITDTGIGIPQKDLKHIFDRFYRVRNNKAAGSGLGLAIAKRLVELNNGKIWAESQEGKGTSFFLSFS